MEPMYIFGGICTLMLIPPLIISIINVFTAPVTGAVSPFPGRVSVLVPARNEENAIGTLLKSVSASPPPVFEIIILDDNSDDGTASVARSFVQKDIRVSVINGEPLPPGWLGKNFACHQLAAAASGEFLLFMDADVTISPGAVQYIIADMLKNSIGFASVFPTQKMRSAGEFFLVPMMNWLLLTFLPLRFIYTKKNPSFAAANGQLICISRETYTLLGGHQSVKQNPVEDMALVRAAKKAGIKCKTYLGGSEVSCSMYNSLSRAVAGFSKNFFPGFEIHFSLFLLLLLFLAVVFLLPFIGLFYSTIFLVPVALIILQRVFIARLSRQPVLPNVLLHPFQLLVMIYTGIRSVILFKRGALTWKGRTI